MLVVRYVWLLYQTSQNLFTVANPLSWAHIKKLNGITGLTTFGSFRCLVFQATIISWIKYSQTNHSFFALAIIYEEPNLFILRVAKLPSQFDRDTEYWQPCCQFGLIRNPWKECYFQIVRLHIVCSLLQILLSHSYICSHQSTLYIQSFYWNL